MMNTLARALAPGATLALAWLVWGGVEPLYAQVENFPGVRAEIVYSSRSLPMIAIHRLGSEIPQIFLSSVTSPTEADLLSPLEFGRPGSFTSPEWSPMGTRIAFHGWVDQRGAHQILIAELNARNRQERLLRVTMEGENEDPSWAPDGRHLVYVGYSSWGRGLFIVDILTPGSERALVRGLDARLPSWSPSLAP
jgi:Tol biopolymer transport system component